jgi:hypothetical protein
VNNAAEETRHTQYKTWHPLDYHSHTVGSTSMLPPHGSVRSSSNEALFLLFVH